MTTTTCVEGKVIDWPAGEINYVVIYTDKLHTCFYRFENALNTFNEGNKFYKYIPNLDIFINLTDEMSYIVST